MRPKVYSLLLVVSIALLCLAGWTSYAQKDSSTPSRIVWEYKTLRGNRALIEPTLNDMGLYGWELIFYDDDGERGNGSFTGTYYFKRQKQ